jgi:hypothetical protein
LRSQGWGKAPERDALQPSNNEYDWLGPGIYFWEANPLRGLEFATEAAKREPNRIKEAFVVGAIIELGFCLDLTTKAGIEMVRIAYDSLRQTSQTAAGPLPENSSDRLRHPLDCAVIQRLHSIAKETGSAFDTVKGVFTEGNPIYPGAGFLEKTHIQIAVVNPTCIKGVFRVPETIVVTQIDLAAENAVTEEFYGRAFRNRS